MSRNFNLFCLTIITILPFNYSYSMRRVLSRVLTPTHFVPSRTLHSIFALSSQISYKKINPVFVTKSLRYSTPKYSLSSRSRILSNSAVSTVTGHYDSVVNTAIVLPTELSDNNTIKDHAALIYAAEHGSIEEVDRLIKLGVDVNASIRHKWTALMHASLEGHKTIVKLLIKAKANINAFNIDGNTALMWAVLRGHTEIVELLIKEGANINTTNKYGFTPLMWASIYNHKKVVELLLNSKADINAANEWGNTALTLAESWRHNEIVETLRSLK